MSVTVLIVAVILMHAYVFWRVLSIRIVSRKLVLVIGLLPWLVFYLGWLYHHDISGSFAVVLVINWLVVLLLSSMALLAADLVTGFGFLLPKYAPSVRAVALLAVALMSTTAFIQALRSPVVRNYEVYLENLPERLDGTVLVGVSDMHLGSLIGKKWLQARVDQINAMQPDIIVMLGDIIDGYRSAMVTELSQLAAPMGVWAVLGNHEFQFPVEIGYEKSVAAFEDAGVKLLRNRWTEISPGFVLAGVDFPMSRRRPGMVRDPVASVASVDSALAGRPPGATVFLSHAPARVEQAAGRGADLMLSGHTHGGQIWPFGYMISKEYPLMGGEYQVDGMTVIVSLGAGTYGPRMRLWRPGEIVHVTLRAK